MTTENEKPIFNLLENWECPVDWDEGIQKVRNEFQDKMHCEIEAYSTYFDQELFCKKVKETASMALDWIFEGDNFGVYAHFTHRSGPGKFDGPLGIAISIGTEGEYYKQLSFRDMIAEEVDSHLGGRIGEPQDKTDSKRFIDEIKNILDSYNLRDDWSYKEYLRLKDE